MAGHSDRLRRRLNGIMELAEAITQEKGCGVRIGAEPRPDADVGFDGRVPLLSVAEAFVGCAELATRRGRIARATGETPADAVDALYVELEKTARARMAQLEVGMGR